MLSIFTPDSRTAAKSQQHEYKTVYSAEKTDSMKSQDTPFKSTRNRVKERNDDMPMENFVLATDNYFMLPRVIHASTNMGIGVVSTSCFRKG
eukprot:11162308-Ditylum_brightwellii.AAC.1